MVFNLRNLRTIFKSVTSVDTIKHPEIDRLIDLVHTEPRVAVTAGRSKTALHHHSDEAAVVDATQLSGIIAYEPAEYTITAWAGTPISEVAAALAANGQTLPFDPLFIEDGATLGGTIAANTAGSGRYRYGGVRDFLIGVTFVTGRGKIVRGGGRVVKNASGFDLSKFMVGSLGRYGALLETSWKVFPGVNDYANLEIAYPSLASLLDASYALAAAPLDLLAFDWWPDQNDGWTAHLRLGGSRTVLHERINRLQRFLQKHATPLETTTLDGEAEQALWQTANRIAWQPANTHLVKVPLPPKQVPAFDRIVTTTPRRYTAAGNIAWVATPDVAELAARLKELRLPGLVLRGPPVADPIIGYRRGAELARRVKMALDPDGVFGEKF